jgi:hypothetical protein
MEYYPNQRHLLEMTTIRRERSLPQDAIGRVEVRQGANVNLRDIVARGVMPSRYLIIEAAQFFRLRKADALPELMQVNVGDTVEAKDVLAARGGRRLLSPVKGIVAYIGDGRVIVQETPEVIAIEAGVEGQVVDVLPGRGVVIETFGALAQGVWGNGRRVISALRMEPEAGIEDIYGDELDMQYRGAVVVTRRPLRETGLLIMESQGLDGIIAPSIEADLIERAMAVKGAILITEGFGSIRMSAAVYNVFSGFNGRQVTVDATMPGRWESRRPEAIINPSGRAGARPPRPNPNIALAPGMTVRLTRAPNAGQVGKVVSLPKTPTLLENGLHVLCAQVELSGGERVSVPLANIEVFGR